MYICIWINERRGSENSPLGHVPLSRILPPSVVFHSIRPRADLVAFVPTHSLSLSFLPPHPRSAPRFSNPLYMARTSLPAESFLWQRRTESFPRNSPRNPLACYKPAVATLRARPTSSSADSGPKGLLDSATASRRGREAKESIAKVVGGWVVGWLVRGWRVQKGSWVSSRVVRARREDGMGETTRDITRAS